ncbi:AMP-binding protein [uncultured Psychrobacter sp.]|uniref:AMP-binding protein n=1 Tax=uncultured Psychrobacter sp. TaxID=259303 RepID=UPI00261CC181|nr:AMP-binding protein [uncultured Psychrobacter sp.]
MMNKPWLAQYPASVPATIDPDQYSSLIELYEESFDSFANQPFSICMGVKHSYDDINQASKAIAAWLQSQSLAPGSVVALMMPNVPQYLPTMLGILRAGYICTPVNPLYTGRELRHQLNDSGAKAIFLVDNFAKALEEVVDDTKVEAIVVSKVGDMMGLKGIVVNTLLQHVKKLIPDYNLDSAKHKVTAFPNVLKQGKKRPLKKVESNLEQTAFLQYTGGTTGLSKGAILTQRNIVAAALQSEAWSEPIVSKIGDEQINMVLALPLYHIFAFMLSLVGVRSGNAFILIPNPRDIPSFIKTLSKQPFHVLPAVNTLFKGLLDHPDFSKLDFSSLHMSQAGGMAATEQTASRWLQVTDCPMIEGWGMTECVAVGSCNVLTNTEFTGSIGVPLPSIDMIVINEDGTRAAVNEAGEICMKGPNVTPGYLNRDNSKEFTEDDYFRTGDIGKMDEQGYFTILDRKKDMILVSGFNVFPNEIESVMLDCEGISDCAVIGVADDSQGESVKIYVIPDNDSVSEAMIKDFAYKNLTRYKCPSHIEFVDDLPKSNVGKVLRQKLREKHLADHA